MSAKVNIKTARDWAHSAYMMTKYEGVYTATKIAHIPGGPIFHRGARELELAIPTNNRNRWYRVDVPPSEEEIEMLFDYYNRYNGRFDDSDKKTAKILQRFDRIEQRFDRIETLISLTEESIEKKIDIVDDKADRIDRRTGDLFTLWQET